MSTPLDVNALREKLEAARLDGTLMPAITANMDISDHIDPDGSVTAALFDAMRKNDSEAVAPFALKDDFTLLPDCIDHVYETDGWLVEVTGSASMTTLLVHRADASEDYLEVRGTIFADQPGARWAVSPTPIINAIAIPESLPALSVFVNEIQSVLDRAEQWVTEYWQENPTFPRSEREGITGNEDHS